MSRTGAIGCLAVILMMAAVLPTGMVAAADEVSVDPRSDQSVWQARHDRAAHADGLACDWDIGWSRIPIPTEAAQSASGPPPSVRARSTGVLDAFWDPGALYVAGQEGLFRTTDCGANWRQLFGYPSSDASLVLVTAVATDSPRRLYVSAYGSVNERTLYVSEDAGMSWGSILVDRRTIVVREGGLAASSSGRLYAASTANTVFRGESGFGYTEDGGKSWIIRWGQEIPGMMFVDPVRVDVIYAVDKFVFQGSRRVATPGIPVERIPHPPPYHLVRSADSGASFQAWSQVDELPGAIAVSVDNSRFWFASYSQHLWQSRDHGQSWQIMDTMPFTDPKQLAVSPHDPRVLYAVSGDGYIWAYREPDVSPPQLP